MVFTGVEIATCQLTANLRIRGAQAECLLIEWDGLVYHAGPKVSQRRRILGIEVVRTGIKSPLGLLKPFFSLARTVVDVDESASRDNKVGINRQSLVHPGDSSIQNCPVSLPICELSVESQTELSLGIGEVGVKTESALEHLFGRSQLPLSEVLLALSEVLLAPQQ